MILHEEVEVRPQPFISSQQSDIEMPALTKESQDLAGLFVRDLRIARKQNCHLFAVQAHCAHLFMRRKVAHCINSNGWDEVPRSGGVRRAKRLAEIRRRCAFGAWPPFST